MSGWCDWSVNAPLVCRASRVWCESLSSACGCGAKGCCGGCLGTGTGGIRVWDHLRGSLRRRRLWRQLCGMRKGKKRSREKITVVSATCSGERLKTVDREKYPCTSDCSAHSQRMWVDNSQRRSFAGVLVFWQNGVPMCSVELSVSTTGEGVWRGLQGILERIFWRKWYCFQWGPPRCFAALGGRLVCFWNKHAAPHSAKQVVHRQCGYAEAQPTLPSSSRWHKIIAIGVKRCVSSD